jgi:nitrate reductase gamma subunit
MSSTAFLVGGVLPYLAATSFIIGVAYRLRIWRRVAQPALMTLYPIAMVPPGFAWRNRNAGRHGTPPRVSISKDSSGVGPLVKEALFFPSLFRGDKTLWLLAWSFHLALALAFVGHLRVLTGWMDSGLSTLGLGAGGIAQLSAIAGGCAGLVLLATVLLLLARRGLVRRVREISAAPDFFALFLLVAVIATGDLMRFGTSHVDLAMTRTWALSLLTFSPAIALPPAVLVHVFCAELLVLYFAFSKLMHFGGFFFTFALVKRS